MQFANQTTLDWDVISAPLVAKSPNKDVKLNNKVALLRDDTMKVLGLVSPSYEVFQNSSLKNLVLPMVEEGLLKIVNMGELGGGKKVFIQAQMSDDYTVAGDKTNAQLTFMNGHDCVTPLSAGVTSVRIICQNTFAQAMTDMNNQLRHHTGLAEKAVTIQETAKFVNEGMKKYQDAAEVLATHRAVGSEVDDLIAAAFGKKSAAEVRARDTIQELFKHGAGNSGKTLWDAVNGITEYTTHHAKKTQSGRFQYANFGTGARVARRAMDVALAMV